MDRNGWTACAGTAGRLPPERVDGITGIRICDGTHSRIGFQAAERAVSTSNQ
jgi:hypothetical protein